MVRDLRDLYFYVNNTIYKISLDIVSVTKMSYVLFSRKMLIFRLSIIYFMNLRL